MMNQNSVHSKTKFLSRKEHFAYIVSLTESMLVVANQQDWEQLTSMEAQRKQQLAQFFTTAVSPDEALWIKTGIERILSIDEQLIRLSETAKQEIADSRNNMAKSQNAANAYSSSAR